MAGGRPPGRSGAPTEEATQRKPGAPWHRQPSAHPPRACRFSRELCLNDLRSVLVGYSVIGPSVCFHAVLMESLLKAVGHDSASTLP